MRDIDGDAWLTGVTGGGDGDDGAKWTSRLRRLTITGSNCSIPLLTTLLRFAPALETLQNAVWDIHSRLSVRFWSPSPPNTVVVASVALVRLQVDIMCVEECAELPRTLTDLDVGRPSAATRAIEPTNFSAFWVSVVVERFAGLARLRFGHSAVDNVYSLETLTANLSCLTDLNVPSCAIPAAPLGNSRLQLLTCTFLRPTTATVAVVDFDGVDQVDTAAPSTLLRDAVTPPPLPPVLLGAHLHTLRLANTMIAFRAPSLECVLAVVTSAPTLTALFDLYTDNDFEFERATAAIADAAVRLHTLGIVARSATTMAPLARFAESLCALEIDGFRPVARIIAEVLPKIRSVVAVRRVAAAVRRLWPPLPRLERLVLGAVLDERDMYAVVARYPSVVDASESRAFDTRAYWHPATTTAATST
jgi:hypothetical protein